MPIYHAPIEDYRFLFNEVLELEKHATFPALQNCHRSLRKTF